MLHSKKVSAEEVDSFFRMVSLRLLPEKGKEEEERKKEDT